MDLGQFPPAPAVSTTRTRRPGAELSVLAGSSPAVQLAVRRLPAKRFALSISSLRTCGGQVAHRVSFFPVSRTHAAGSGCAPTPGSCFPGQGESPRLRRASRAPCLCLRPAPHARAPAVGNSRTVFVAAFGPRTPAVLSGCKPTLSFYFPGRGESPPPVPCGGEKTRRAKAPARPQRTETLEKLSSAPWLFKRFPCQPAVCGRRPRKPASSAGKGEIGRRALEWGSKGALPRPLANLCLLSFRKKVEARRGLSDK